MKKIQIWKGISRLALFLILCLILFYVWYSGYQKNKADQQVLKSRYTYSVDINDNGDVVDRRELRDDSERAYETADFSTVSVKSMAKVWIDNFLSQFTPSYLPWSKALKKIEVAEPSVLNEEEKTVLITFSAQKKDATSEYFSSWNGVLDDGIMQCEWVVTFNLEENDDNTATIYVTSMTTPEDYGLAQYNSKLKDNVTKEKETSQTKVLTGYEIKNGTLYVTYDGGVKYTTVPLEVENLLYQENSQTKMQEGSYQVSTSMTAFVYGGKVKADKTQVPVTLMYSKDMGNNWITSEIESIYDMAYSYVNFIDDQNGIIVIGYDKNQTSESSRIYATQDGGESWLNIGEGPLKDILKGVYFVDEKIGFFCYNYTDGMDGNLYMTKDGGQTFEKVTFDEQELDSTAANAQSQEAGTQEDTAQDEDNQTGRLSWKDVYKEATVPIYDSTQNNLVVYLTQGKNGVYNDGKTVAKYQSSDKGNTWKYIGQLEMTASDS